MDKMMFILRLLAIVGLISLSTIPFLVAATDEESKKPVTTETENPEEDLNDETAEGGDED